MRAAVLGVLMMSVTGGALAQTAMPDQKAQLVPTGALRAAIVTIPFLAKKDASGNLSGVAPTLAEFMAKVLEVPYQPTAFGPPAAGVAAVKDGTADVTFLAPTPERVVLIDFAHAFMEMEVTLIVTGDSPIKTLADADQLGRKIVVYEKTANSEMVAKTVRHATVLFVPLFGWKKAFEMIKNGEADGYVDLRDQLVAHQSELPGSRIIAGAYGRNAMAMGYAKDKPAAAAFVKMFTDAAIKLNIVKPAITKAGIHGAVLPGI